MDDESISRTVAANFIIIWKGMVIFLDKLRKGLCNICDVMELIMAVFVVIAIVIAAIAIIPAVEEFWNARMDRGSLIKFLDNVFMVIIGIEFLKMLCKPDTGNIIEVLIFVSARHLIMQSPNAIDTLLFIIGICVLFVFQKFMEENKDDESILKKIRIKLRGNSKKIDVKEE